MVRNFKQFCVLDFKKRDQTFHSDDLRSGLTKEIELELCLIFPNGFLESSNISTNLSFHFPFAPQWSSY